LPPNLEVLISLLYQACANEITQRKWFETPTLKEIVAEIKEMI